MFAPRWLIAAGIGLVAMALGPSGHGLWWLVGLVFAFGHCGRRLHACGPRGRHSDDRVTGQRGADVPGGPQPSREPDPTRDSHKAFPRA